MRVVERVDHPGHGPILRGIYRRGDMPGLMALSGRWDWTSHSCQRRGYLGGVGGHYHRGPPSFVRISLYSEQALLHHSSLTNNLNDAFTNFLTSM